jgi:hypothetical protein
MGKVFGFLARPGVVKALAVVVCAGLYAWKGAELDPDQLAEVVVAALAASQLVRRVGDVPPAKPDIDSPRGP